MFRKGVNWNDYPTFFKRGTFIQKRYKTWSLRAEDVEDSPPMHNARRNPDAVVRRSSVEAIDIPPLGKVANRDAVVFEGVDWRI